MINYSDCIKARRQLIKETMEKVEAVAIKYDIEPEELHQIRLALRGGAFRMQDSWARLFVKLVDDKYTKKISGYGYGESKIK